MKEEPLKRQLLVFLLLLSGLYSRLEASCGAASCPINTQQFITHGSLQLGYVYEYINQNQIYVGSNKSFVGAIRQHHDEVQTLNMSNTLRLFYGVTNNFSLGIDLPFIHREHAHIHHHQGEDVWESWNFSGLGDLRLNSQFDFFLETGMSRRITILAGIKLATGVRDAKNNEGEEAEVTLQPGSGSTDGVVGFNYDETLLSVPMLTGQYATLPLSIGVKYQFNGKGTNGWRFGNSFVASVGTAYQLVKRASILLQVNGRFQEYADVGSTGEPKENTGGTWIFISPGFNVQFNDGISAYAYIQIPLYQNVHGIQQASPFNLQLGISMDVNLLD